MSDTLEESLPAHAPLGPSSAEGWSTCADYVNANRGLPDYSTEVAAEGTAAHAISDICLGTGLDADDFLGMPTRIGDFVFAWEEDDAFLLQRGIDDIRTAAHGATLFGEQRVDISPWTLPGQFGTLDRAFVTFDALTETWWVVVVDLKWGRGVAVSPVTNKQIMLYALGFYRSVARVLMPADAVPQFRLIIDQPRHAGGGGVWQTTLADLLAFGDWIRDRAALTAQPDATRTASLAGCMWCRARRTKRGCDTYDDYMIALLGLCWADIDMGLLMDTEIELPRVLTPERRAFLLLHKGAIERWLDQLDDECVADALVGKPIGELKAVEGRKTPDAWTDKVAAEAAVVPILGENSFTKKLKTPTQVSKLVPEDQAAAVGAFIKRGTRPPTLVPLADARAAITVAQSQMDEEPDLTEPETGES